MSRWPYNETKAFRPKPKYREPFTREQIARKMRKLEVRLARQNVLLRCPRCGTEKEVMRRPGWPKNAIRIEQLCPDCITGSK